MDVVLLLVLAASGLSAVSSQLRRQYHFVYDQKNMTEAQKYCRETYTDLATVDNMEDVKNLNDTVDQSKGSIGFWIGLYDDVNSWRWSLSNTSFYRDGEAEFRLWKDGEPNNYNSREHCTALIGRRWVDDDCINCYKSVCMDVRGLNVTFVFIETPMNWTEAQSYCREHHTDLASVRNMTENQKVADLVPAGQLAWIGLYRDSWKWSDGSDSSFRHWAQGQPNKDDRSDACVVADFSKDGTWLDIPCDLNRPFICYSLPAVQTTSSSSTTTSSTTQPDAAAVQTTSSSSTTTSSTTQPDTSPVQTTSSSSSTTSSTTQPDTSAVQTTSSSSTTTSSTMQPDAVTVTTKQVIKVRLERKDSSLDLNDPAVMEQMLKEVQQRLKDQGVKGDVKLSWRKQADGKVFHEEEETKEKKETC
ncbi:macrophage mannose receptor 1-like isoform 2-T2 [Acanthopagrus schlegelii]